MRVEVIEPSPWMNATRMRAADVSEQQHQTLLTYGMSSTDFSKEGLVMQYRHIANDPGALTECAKTYLVSGSFIAVSRVVTPFPSSASQVVKLTTRIMRKSV